MFATTHAVKDYAHDSGRIFPRRKYHWYLGQSLTYLGLSLSWRFAVVAKRLLDILISFAGLLVLSPIMAATAIAVRIDSPGPIFYRAVRTGLNGRPFIMYKFRTMVENADKIGGGSTGKNDPRITRVGLFLRRYKLDELPQLINVLKGDMSLVGPRPELPMYTSQYEGDELLILTVKPGITDYASLEFRHLDAALGDEDPDKVYEERVMPRKNALRVKYAKEHSLCVDTKILVKTVVQVLRG